MCTNRKCAIMGAVRLIPRCEHRMNYVAEHASLEPVRRYMHRVTIIVERCPKTFQ